jgi:hypothetical protein
MKNKKILIGSLIALGTIVSYFIFKKRKDLKEAESVSFDDSNLKNEDINYVSADGSVKSVISIKKYLDFLKRTPSSDSENKLLLDKRIYSLFNNLNLRNDASLSNQSKVGIVPNKYTYLGRVSSLALDEIGDLWFVITPNQSNIKLVKNFNWGKGKVNPYRRYVKATAVFAEHQSFIAVKK